MSQPAPAVVSRLESALNALPKEGMKAAVVLGVVERVKEMIDEAIKINHYIKCLSNARGYCKNNFCNPNCAHIYSEEKENTTTIGKYKNTPLGIEITPETTTFRTKELSLIIDNTGRITVQYSGGHQITVTASKLDEVYDNSYTIKYAIRKIGKPLRIMLEDLVNCAKANAIVC